MAAQRRRASDARRGLLPVQAAQHRPLDRLGLFALVLLVAPLVFTQQPVADDAVADGHRDHRLPGLQHAARPGRHAELRPRRVLRAWARSWRSTRSTWSAQGQLPIPVSLMPLVGGLAGMFFAVVLGYVTTKKAGTTFAMITLGIGELVCGDVADVPRVLRRRGRHLGQPRGRPSRAGHHLRPADPGVLPDRGLLLHLHRG